MRGPTAYRNYSPRARMLAWGLDVATLPVLPILRRLAPRGPAPKTPRAILVIRLDHLGDMLMTTPALAALRGAYPAARIDVLAAPWGKGALAGNPHIDRILEAVAPWYDPRRGELPAPDEVLGAAAMLRREGYDWGFDMRGDPRVALFYLLPAARRRFGFAALGFERLLTDARLYERSRSPLDLALDLASEAGVRGASRRPVFTVDGGARRRAAERLLAGGLPAGSRYAVIAPGSNRVSAQWGGERFAAVCDRLTEGGLQVVLTGRDADAGVTRDVSARTRRPPLDTTGQLDLAELAALLERAQVAVTNDSGASHLAAAVGCPIVAVFGPTDPSLTFPYADGERFVSLSVPIDHPRPCFVPGCPSDHGFSRIAPDEVASAALRISRQFSHTNG
ncbi:MAG TPA: glycosyltransferase family 9 protein [Candidatus Polarisedimenticolia bacterium]|nr:glycosyltransferase family 9 protein [Candidatus Polarisedimenticolia bacterium]